MLEQSCVQTLVLQLQPVEHRWQVGRSQRCGSPRFHRSVPLACCEGRTVQLDEVSDEGHDAGCVRDCVVHCHLQVGSVTGLCALARCPPNEHEHRDRGGRSEAPRPCTEPCGLLELRLGLEAQPLKVRAGLGPGVGQGGNTRPRRQEPPGRLRAEAPSAACSRAEECPQRGHHGCRAVADVRDGLVAGAVGCCSQPRVPMNEGLTCRTHRCLVRKLVETDKPANGRLPEPRNRKNSPAVLGGLADLHGCSLPGGTSLCTQALEVADGAATKHVARCQLNACLPAQSADKRDDLQ
mmetsp:Transcript_53359/g.152045  ORF Transcript_53359/g.152045 Transcript_53359/m.152045 type:complete len:294 (-) Transcript_53359:928-1809(-)